MTKGHLLRRVQFTYKSVTVFENVRNVSLLHVVGLGPLLLRGPRLEVPDLAPTQGDRRYRVFKGSFQKSEMESKSRLRSS